MKVNMKTFLPAVTLLLLIALPLSADYNEGFWGTVYEGGGTGSPSSYAHVRAQSTAKDTTVSCNASGGYSVRNLPTGYYYELTAWNKVGEETWYDWAWEYLATGWYVKKDFHLNRGQPEKK